MISADFVIVGSGLTGSTIARTLADAGREVLVLERRDHLGGNVHDHVHEPSGIRIHTYGPHFFRTSSERIWDFACRFGEFHPYMHRILSAIDGELVPWPPQRAWIERLCGKDWHPGFFGQPRNFEEACLSMMPPIVYSKMVEPYNVKQWGKPCVELSASLCKRFDLRDGDDRLTPHAKYQGIPKDGYAAWMANMLKGIDVRTGFDYLQRREEVQARRHLVFTGPIDEFFGFKLGKLEYRAQQRQHVNMPNEEFGLAAAQVNIPFCKDCPHIRTIEWKRFMPNAPKMGTVLTRETPYSPENPDRYEYPFPDDRNARLYAEYRAWARAWPNVTFAGRLGRNVYLDMDGAIGAALRLADELLSRSWNRAT